MKECPSCKSAWADYRCSDPKCVLNGIPKPTHTLDLAKLKRVLRYPSVRNTYLWMKNRFIKRPDLIRTGLSKSSWSDKVDLMLYGMMNLLVEFIEDECAYEVVQMDYHCLDNGQTVGEEILDLYIDWKINYPKLLREEAELLDSWAETHLPWLSDGVFKFGVKEPFTKEESDRRFDLYMKKETEISEKEQEMLSRLVRVRRYLWT